MKNRPIIIEKKYLIFRDEANHLRDAVKKKKDRVVYLDFSRVRFFSRSFADEFLNMILESVKKRKAIKIINIKPDLEKFLLQIKEIKEKIKKETK